MEAREKKIIEYIRNMLSYCSKTMNCQTVCNYNDFDEEDEL